MKVLVVTGSYPPMPCGVGDYSARLADALAREPGVEVAVLTSEGAAAIARDGGPMLFSIMRGWRLAEWSKLSSAIRAWQPDIVHLQYPTQGYTGRLLPSLAPVIARASGARVVRTWHEVMSWHGLRDWRGVVIFLLQLSAAGPIITVRPNYRTLLHPLLRRLISPRRLRHIVSASAIPRSKLNTGERAELRTRLLAGWSRLVVFFGFLHPQKGADLVFDIADPECDSLLFVGGHMIDPRYATRIGKLAATSPWRGHAALMGFVKDKEVADILAVADAVVLPFRDGGGGWNTSIEAAVLQGTPVVTTSLSRCGLDESRLVHYSIPGDVSSMHSALGRIAGQRRSFVEEDGWKSIAQQHLRVYAERGRDDR